MSDRTISELEKTIVNRALMWVRAMDRCTADVDRGVPDIAEAVHGLQRAQTDLEIAVRDYAATGYPEVDR